MLLAESTRLLSLRRKTARIRGYLNAPPTAEGSEWSNPWGLHTQIDNRTLGQQFGLKYFHTFIHNRPKHRWRSKNVLRLTLFCLRPLLPFPATPKTSPGVVRRVYTCESSVSIPLGSTYMSARSNTFDNNASPFL